MDYLIGVRFGVPGYRVRVGIFGARVWDGTWVGVDGVMVRDGRDGFGIGTSGVVIGARIVRIRVRIRIC